jgi:hypothetical protein
MSYQNGRARVRALISRLRTRIRRVPIRAKGSLVLAAIVALAVVRSHCGTRRDGMTIDEPWDLVAGVAAARDGSYAWNPEHLALAKLWVGAFAPSDFEIPAQQIDSKWQERAFVEQVFYSQNQGQRVQDRARVAMWIFHSIVLLVFGLMLWRAFGFVWAAGTLTVLAFDPTVGAELPVVMGDLPFALMLSLAAVSVGLLVDGWRWPRVIGTGIAFGLTLCTKLSALAGILALGLTLVVASGLQLRSGGWRASLKCLGKTAVVGLVAIVTLWAIYRFRFHANSDGTDPFNQPMAEKLAGMKPSFTKAMIGFADDWHLLPRAYLWGLIDVMRTGYELSEPAILVWGDWKENIPWYTWPSFVLVKVPLAGLLLTAVAAALLWRSRLALAARWTLWAQLASTVAVSYAVMTGTVAFAGVRYVLPVVVALAVLAGAAFAQSWKRRSRPLLAAVGILFTLSVAMTIREPRIWEYHNELVGGTEEAYRQFRNEGVDLGQCFSEMVSYYDRVLRPSGKPLYSLAIYRRAEAHGLGASIHELYPDIRETNTETEWDGYFIVYVWQMMPIPYANWDPAVELAGLKPVVRLGVMEILEGKRPVKATDRAWDLADAVLEYIYAKNGDDWALVIKRLEEVLAVVPDHDTASVELGNAFVRIGDAPHAIAAYRRILTASNPPSDFVKQVLEDQIKALETDGAHGQPIADPFLE